MFGVMLVFIMNISIMRRKSFSIFFFFLFKGITLWEIYSLGERPFGSLNNTIVKKILNNPTENLSRYLPKPTYCHSDEIYTHIILSCLTHNVTIRPRFRDLKERIFLIFN